MFEKGKEESNIRHVRMMEFFVIAVCTLSKVTVNYVCYHYTIPLCCPGELPKKLTLFKQDGWFFC